MEITLDTAHFSSYDNAVLALNWYSRLDDIQRQEYIDNIGQYRALAIYDFVITVSCYMLETDANDIASGFDKDLVADLHQRIEAKLIREGVL